MLLDDDVVTDREPKSRALSGGFHGEEWIEHFLLHVGRNAVAVVANPNFNVVAKVLGCSGHRRLVVVPPRVRYPLGRRVKAI